MDVVPRVRRPGPTLFPLALVFLIVGTATAVVYPFLSLFLSTAVHASPAQVTAFLVVAPLAGVLVGTLVGRLSDRRIRRRWVLVGGSVAGLVGMSLSVFVRDYWILLGTTAILIALAGSLFPQTFAYGREVLAARGSSRSAMGMSTLRTVFSVAWVIGPPLAAVLLRAGGFAYLYGMAAGLYAVAALVTIFWLDDVPRTAPAPPSGDAVPDTWPVPRSTLLLTAVAFTMLQCPLTLAVQALPLFISTDLGGDTSAAGLILGLCAALEIPLMIGLGALAYRVRPRLLILAGSGCGIAYYTLTATATDVWVLAAIQVLNALFIAAVSGLGISYVQDMMPQRPGQATTLFTNTFPIGAILAGPLFGLAQHLGYRFAYGISAVLCAAGLLVLLGTSGGRRRLAVRG